MTFTFDAKAARKRTPTPANSANSANPEPQKSSISGFSNISGTRSANRPSGKGWGYSSDDLKEMDKLLRQLAELEGWTREELEEMLDCRRRMAPARVPEVLQTLRESSRAALAPWPEKPAKRSKVVLCVLEGGKADQPTEPEAA